MATPRTVKAVVTVKVAWWLRYYLYGVAFTAFLMGAQPDMAKVARKVSKAVKAEVRWA